jgi:serine/threonine protein kinase/tetratricopeptide (TPR) repeat protein
MSDGSATPDTAKAALARGASIGRYVVLGLVGRGGMGEVYAAYDPELDRKVAVKLLRVKPGAGVSLIEGRQRTLREAQAIARLSHPNVVVVYDVGTFEDKVFIAMEFVEGHTGGFWAQSQTRTWQETLKVYMAAGRGLVAAHAKGLVHRDFKPDNIMVSRDGQVRVMDFGLARQVNEKPIGGLRVVGPDEGNVTTTQRLPAPMDEPEKPRPIVPLDGATLVVTPVASDAGVTADSEPSYSQMFDQRLTRTGAMMGTPAYMAPEQFRGNPTDARTDQFAFCIALYEALYGERPFAGNTLMALTTNVVNGRIREPPANTKVPVWVRKILLRGLRVNADERWPSMVALLDALGKNPAVARKRAALGIGAGVLAVALFAFGLRPSLADPKQVCTGGPEKLAGIWELGPPGQESPRQARLHKAFLASGKSYAKDVWATTSRALTRYAHSWADMYKENCEATAVRKEQSEDMRDLRTSCLAERLGGLRALTDVFSEATGEVVENAVSASNALASLDRCADVPLLKAVVRPPEDRETRVKVESLRNKLAELKARFDAGNYRDAVRMATALVEEGRIIAYQPVLAESLTMLGTIAYKSDDAPRAKSAFLEAYLVADISRHDEVRAEAAALLVYVVGFQLAEFDEGHKWAGLADAVLRRLGGHELLRAWLLNDLGTVYSAEGKKDNAASAFQESVRLKEKALGVDHPDVGVSEGNLAITLAETGNYKGALDHVERAVDMMERGLGAAHPDVALQLENRGEILNGIGRPYEARKSFEAARNIWERELGPESRSLASALTGIGISQIAEGDASSAVVSLERALRIREITERDQTKKAETDFNLARALWESNKDRARARALAARAKQEYVQAALKPKVIEVDQWLRARDAS